MTNKTYTAFSESDLQKIFVKTTIPEFHIRCGFCGRTSAYHSRPPDCRVVLLCGHKLPQLPERTVTATILEETTHFLT